MKLRAAVGFFTTFSAKLLFGKNAARILLYRNFEEKQGFYQYIQFVINCIIITTYDHHPLAQGGFVAMLKD